MQNCPVGKEMKDKPCRKIAWTFKWSVNIFSNRRFQKGTYRNSTPDMSVRYPRFHPIPAPPQSTPTTASTLSPPAPVNSSHRFHAIPAPPQSTPATASTLSPPRPNQLQPPLPRYPRPAPINSSHRFHAIPAPPQSTPATASTLSPPRPDQLQPPLPPYPRPPQSTPATASTLSPPRPNQLQPPLPRYPCPAPINSNNYWDGRGQQLYHNQSPTEISALSGQLFNVTCPVLTQLYQQ